MATVTITNVPADLKRALVVACARRGTTVSAELRERIPVIIQEIEGHVPLEHTGHVQTWEDAEFEMQAARDETAMLKRTNRILTRAIMSLPDEQAKGLIDKAIREIQAPVGTHAPCVQGAHAPCVQGAEGARHDG